ncbi:segregation/condensation protein A [bacterium]|nr:segregation/condensation protein A [bacterium]
MERYRITIPDFEGPLDLLLHLVRKSEYDIFDIPISKITHQYLEFIEMMRELNLEVAGEYLVMSATLMKIKSALLLPQPEVADGEEAPEDPRAELVRQMLEYERFRDAAYQMDEREMLGRDVFARKFTAPEIEEALAEPGELRATIYELMKAFQQVLKRVPKDNIHHIAPERFSVRQRMTQITEILAKNERVSFESLFDHQTTKIEVVTTFLAILELMKLNMVFIVQDEQFGSIGITSRIEAAEAGARELASDFDGDEDVPEQNDAEDAGDEPLSDDEPLRDGGTDADDEDAFDDDDDEFADDDDENEDDDEDEDDDD